MQFEKMKVKELKAIIAKYKKEHVLSNYSKLKKKQLVEILNSKFDLKDGKIYLKNKSVAIIDSASTGQLPTMQDNSGLTKGQITFNKSISAIERKANLGKQRGFAKRIRGNE